MGETKIGRPSIKTPELIREICARISEGSSLASVCKHEDMPGISTAWRWLSEDSSFQEEYARAIQARAMAHADRILDISQAVLSGKIEPDRARVALDGMKWTASRLLPRLYGDRTQVEATVTHTHTLHLEALKELSELVRGTRSGYIDGQAFEIVDRVAVPGERAPIRQPAPRVKPRQAEPIAKAAPVLPAPAAGSPGPEYPPAPATGGGRVRARPPRSLRAFAAEAPPPPTPGVRQRGAWKKYKKEK